MGGGVTSGAGFAVRGPVLFVRSLTVSVFRALFFEPGGRPRAIMNVLASSDLNQDGATAYHQAHVSSEVHLQVFLTFYFARN